MKRERERAEKGRNTVKESKICVVVVVTRQTEDATGREWKEEGDHRRRELAGMKNEEECLDHII